jgi:hypothetical protein
MSEAGLIIGLLLSFAVGTWFGMVMMAILTVANDHKNIKGEDHAG